MTSYYLYFQNTTEGIFDVTRKTTTIVFVSVPKPEPTQEPTLEDRYQEDEWARQDFDILTSRQEARYMETENSIEPEEEKEPELRVTLVRTELSYEGGDISGKGQSVHVITERGDKREVGEHIKHIQRDYQPTRICKYNK